MGGGQGSARNNKQRKRKTRGEKKLINLYLCALDKAHLCTWNPKRRDKRQETNRNEWRLAVKWGKGYVDRDRLSDDLSYVRHCERKPNPFLNFRRDMQRVFDLFDCLIDWLLQDGDEAGQLMICRILRETQRERERERELRELAWYTSFWIGSHKWWHCNNFTQHRRAGAGALLPHCVARADWQLSWDRNRGSHWKLLLRDSGDLTNPNIWHAKLANSLWILSWRLINNASILFPFCAVSVKRRQLMLQISPSPC